MGEIGKMMKSLKYFSILLIAFFVFSCSQSVTEPVIDNLLGQKLFFEVEYINNAWGYAHWGIQIGDSGDIYSYRYDPGVKYEEKWKPNQEGVYYLQELNLKFDHQKQFVRTLDEELLKQMKLLISGANKGALSKPFPKGADIGSWKFKAYTYDNAVKKYTEVILRVEGDWFAENKTWQASIIVLWLEAQKAYWLESLK